MNAHAPAPAAGPLPPHGPGKELAALRAPDPSAGPDPSDLELFEDAPGNAPAAPDAPTAVISATPLVGTDPGRLPPEGPPNGLGWPRGSVGPSALLPVPPPGPPPGPGPGTLPGGRIPFEQPEQHGRSLWVTVLAGAAALACGATLVVMAGSQDREAVKAAAPITGATVPGLRGYPEPPEGNPGDGGDSAGSLSEAESAVSPGVQHGEAANDPPRAAKTGEPGSEDGKGATTGGADGKGDGEKGDSASGGSGSGSGSGSGGGSGGNPAPGPGSAGGWGDGGSGWNGGSGGGSGWNGGSIGRPTSSPDRTAAMQAVNYPDRYWYIRGNGVGYLDRVSRGAAAFTVKEGLTDSNCYSFALSNGRYLRHSNFRLRADSDTGGTFRKDATFCPRSVGNGTIMLESVNYPGRFIRHRDFQLWLDPYQNSGLYRADTAFRMVSG
ncbi:AbfB domain-containing protein [Streptomyces sp. NPDC088124]|uniref:AbfB domain-containing protein n=1 Tax=Streptomyces sp. NPDC088124 TaxID=3154654 RepID=UPI003444EDE9